MKPVDLPIAVAQALLANSPAGIAVFAGDTGECLLANGMMEAITGGSVEAMRLQNFRTLASWRESGLADAAEATLADGVPRRYETTMQTSFGKGVTLDSSLYRFDFEGKPHLMLVASDVTERRRAEQALAVREQELRTLIETVPDLIVRYDRELRRTYVNPAWEQASGLSAREVIDVLAAAIPKVPKPVHDEYMQKLRLVLESGAPQKIGFSWVNAFGAELYLEYVIVPEHDRSGAIAGVLAVGRDLSERKRAEESLHQQALELEQEVAERQVAQEALQEQALLLENEMDERRHAQDELEALNESLEERVKERTDELEQANVRLRELDRMKSMFIASMSHELRTPLNSVIGFSRILLNEWLGPLNAEQKEDLDTVLRSGNHLLSLINDVIDVSRIEAGMIEVVPEVFDICAVVSEAAKAFEKDAGDKEVKITVQAMHHSMQTDRKRLLQCLLNLVSNAVKYTEKGTITICVQLADNGGILELSVADTGIGIAEVDLDKLFSPFVRIVSHLTSTVPGTGLGLYLTRKLVKEVLRGEITVTSVMGEGSRFMVTVPVNLTANPP